MGHAQGAADPLLRQRFSSLLPSQGTISAATSVSFSARISSVCESSF
jgi:hypothetical protein